MSTPKDVSTLRQKSLWMVLESHPLDVVVWKVENQGGKLKVIAFRIYSEAVSGGTPEIYFDKPMLRRQQVAARRRPLPKPNATSKESTTIQKFNRWCFSLVPVLQRT
jgi:hypothetical protein